MDNKKSPTPQWMRGGARAIDLGYQGGFLSAGILEPFPGIFHRVIGQSVSQYPIPYGMLRYRGHNGHDDRIPCGRHDHGDKHKTGCQDGPLAPAYPEYFPSGFVLRGSVPPDPHILLGKISEAEKAAPKQQAADGVELHDEE